VVLEICRRKKKNSKFLKEFSGFIGDLYCGKVRKSCEQIMVQQFIMFYVEMIDSAFQQMYLF
jgi:hypothetical protein